MDELAFEDVRSSARIADLSAPEDHFSAEDETVVLVRPDRPVPDGARLG